MTRGSNKCPNCGQFAGRGHKCRTGIITPDRPDPRPSTSTPRPDVSERVARAAAALNNPSEPPRILVSGWMNRDELQNALYSGWRIKGYADDGKDCVAILEATGDGSNINYMVGRLESFGTVGAWSEFTPEDVVNRMQRIGPVTSPVGYMPGQKAPSDYYHSHPVPADPNLRCICYGDCSEEGNCSPRCGSCNSLGKINGRTELASLRYMVQHSDENVRDAAYAELTNRAKSDLMYMRSMYPNSNMQPVWTGEVVSKPFDRLPPLMKAYESAEEFGDCDPEDLRLAASVVSWAAEDENFHTFNTWFREDFKRKHGGDLIGMVSDDARNALTILSDTTVNPANRKR